VTSDERWHDASDQELPPPTPFDRPAPPAVTPAVGPAGGSARHRIARRIRVGLFMLGAATIGFAVGVAAPDAVNLPAVLGGDRSSTEAERDAGLVELLELITRTEGEMLAFNDSVGERLRDAQEEEAALAAVAAVAADAVDGLVGLRPDIVERSGHRTIEDVRDVYLPHLDSWIEYLTALSERPRLLFTDGEQQPYLLRINATAADFSDALEALIAMDPGPAVVELAERILDDGFRGMGSDAQV